MNCPKDADTTKLKEKCFMRIIIRCEPIYCTRKPRHGGKHHCHEKGKCLAVWGG